MLEEFRLRGIPMELAGTKIMQQMMKGEVTTKDLTDKQILKVLDAWDGRHIVPLSKQEYVDVIRPAITKEEVQQGIYTQEEYDRNYVEMIEKYLKTIMI